MGCEFSGVTFATIGPVVSVTRIDTLVWHRRRCGLERYLSANDAARILQVTAQSVHQMIRRGDLPVAGDTESGFRLFRRADVEALAVVREARRSAEATHPHGRHGRGWAMSKWSIRQVQGTNGRQPMPGRRAERCRRRPLLRHNRRLNRKHLRSGMAVTRITPAASRSHRLTWIARMWDSA